MKKGKEGISKWKPISILFYAISVPTWFLVKRINEYYEGRVENGSIECFVKIDPLKPCDQVTFDVCSQVENYLEPILQETSKSLGITLRVGWTPYQSVENRHTKELYDTTFIYSSCYTTTGPGFSYLNICSDLSPPPEEKHALQQVSDLLDLLSERDTFFGFTLTSGTIQSPQI